MKERGLVPYVRGHPHVKLSDQMQGPFTSILYPQSGFHKVERQP